jgi:uncharacterized membrane protein YqjE
VDVSNGQRHTLPSRSPNVPLGELLGDVAGHAQGIVRAEVRLAFAQVREEVSTGTRRVVLRSSAALFALLGVIMMLVALVLGLSTMMAAWLATVIAAGIVLLVSVILLGIAARSSV